jgi:hypothetical protein
MNGRARWIVRLLQVAILVVVVWGIYRAVAPRADSFAWSQLGAWRPAPAPLLASLVVLIAVYIAHALLWRQILRDLRVAQPSAGMTLRIYLLAGLGRYIPGKLWQLAGLAVLAKRAGLPAGGAAAAALLGQFAFLTTGFLFLAVLLPQWSGGVAARIAGIALVSFAGTLWMILATPAGERARSWARARLVPVAGERLDNALDLAERIRGRDAVLWGVWYGLTWAALGLAFSLFVSAFVPEAAAHSRQLAGALAASYLAGFLVLFAPAGIGVREGAMAGLLAAVPSVPLSAAVVVAVVSRVWFTAGELIPLTALPFLRGSSESRPETPSEPDSAPEPDRREGGEAPGR